MSYSIAERKWRLLQALQALGFTREEATELRRIQMTLHRWSAQP